LADNSPGRQLVEELHHFCFAITYTFHRKHFADGFIDPRFEDLRPTYELFIDNLNPDKKAVVSQLHELTYKYGFVITELWDGLIDSQKLIDAFTKKRRKSEKIDKIPTFIFTKKKVVLMAFKYQQKNINKTNKTLGSGDILQRGGKIFKKKKKRLLIHGENQHKKLLETLKIIK